MKTIHKMVHRLDNLNLGILFIRVALGVVFIHAGWLKVTNINFAITGFAAIGMPPFLAYFVAYTELFCGILFILGIFVRYAGILTAIIMLVAIIKVHLVNGFGLQNGGYEYIFVLLLGSLAIITLGSGTYSLSHLLKKKT